MVQGGRDSSTIRGLPNEPASLARALDPHAVPCEEVARRYPGPSGLVRRILGVLPHAVGYFEIWPPALTTYNLAVPALLDVPKCDMGMGIGPELRAMVAHAASRGFGCRYCTAHTAIMGTLVRGPVDGLQLSGRIAAVREPGELRAAERAAVRYAEAVARVPCRLDPDLMAQLRRHHRPDRLEGIVLVAACMGYLNRCMDALGTPLETAVHEAVRDPLGEQGWEAGKHDRPGAAPADGRAELARPSRLGLLREVPAAVAYEKAAFADVPAGLDAQRSLLTEQLGFVPYYVPGIARESARRVFVHWLVERLATPGSDEAVDPALKYTLAWIHARAAGNQALAAHFAFLAHRAGATVPALAAASSPSSSSDPSPRGTALALARATSGAAAEIDPRVIDALASAHSPASIVELLVVLSIVAGLHRYTVSVPPAQLEPEVAAFMAEHGDGLGLRVR